MKNILLVDDSKIVISILSDYMEELDCNFDTAMRGAEAMELFLLNEYDLFIVDINMPEMDGYSLVKKIRQQEQYKKTPIVMCSTENELKDIEKGKEYGADKYLIKPVKKSEFIETIKKLLG